MLISTTSVTILMVLFLLLCAATRFKGESPFAAFIILLSVVPDYIYTLSRIFGWNEAAIIIAPLAYSSNLTIMPLMYLLAHKGFNPYYRFRGVHLLHFIPAVLFAIGVALGFGELSIYDIHNYTLDTAIEQGRRQTAINFILITLQLVIYFGIIFRLLHKVKKYMLSHYTNADMFEKRWIPRFITLIGVLMLASLISYNIWDWAPFWFFYITNTVAMGYLIFHQFTNAMNPMASPMLTSEHVREAEAEFEEINRTLKESPADGGYNTSGTPLAANKPSDEDAEQLTLYAHNVQQWLQNSGAYINPNLSLKEVSLATGISANNISKAINTVLEKNFFDLVNGFRIEKSKQLLISKKEMGLTLETIAEQCGFNSQHTLCRTFRKQVGVSTTQWLKLPRE